jgi:hypothetical protein
MDLSNAHEKNGLRRKDKMKRVAVVKEDFINS